MARKLTVVISQGQSANPAKRKLEEDVVAGLLFERGVEVTVVPNLYDLTPDGTGRVIVENSHECARQLAPHCAVAA